MTRVSRKGVNMRPAAIFAAAALCATQAVAADRVRASMKCVSTPERLVYDCVVELANARTSAPLEGAEVVVGADMPSMPMAHNVRPEPAKPTGTAGQYGVRLMLEMHGEWALRIRISGPLRDQAVQVLSFDEAGAAPPVRKRVGPGGSHKH